MNKFVIKPNQWFGVLILSAISIAFLRFAIAIAAFSPQGQPTGYIAQPDVTNYNLTGGNETVFLVSYEREFWSGNVYAYPVDATGAIDFAAERWTLGAANVIDAQDWNTGRYIATMKDDGSSIPFRYTSLSTIQQGYFPASTINLFPATGANIVDFLRGDRTNEGPESLRIRNYVLGDIIHSRPYYVADSTYPTVFVGSNDGMLHALNTSDGSERWAYVPSMLLPKMINLAKPYGGVSNPHDYFMDGRVNVGNVTISSTPKRIIVGALGAGGKGLFALDITGSAGLNATSDTTVASKILWEISPTKVNYANPSTANAYSNLGYTYGTPVIAKVGGVDAVIVGNGYNDGIGNYSSCTNYATCGGDYAAYLYVIRADNGQLIGKVKAGASGTLSDPNGLFNPAPIDTDGDGSVDRVYAGDLNGTMWKFDLSAASSASWTSTALLTTSPAQPITSTPGVGIHPNGGYMVNFGTGSMFVDSTADNSTYYLYGVWDGAPIANTTLISQTIQERSYTVPTGTTRVRRIVNAVTPDWGTVKGWQVALPAGERVLGEGSFIENGRFYFNTHNPTLSILTPNPCVLPDCANQTTVYGENWLMELDYLSGGALNEPFLDLDGNLLLDNADRVKYTASDTLPTGKNVGDFIAGTDGIPIGKFISNGATSQPILVQLRTLNTTLFTQNPDIVFPYNDVGFGVTGGHFDVDIFYGTSCGATTSSGGSVATATITVGSTGANLPATLGGIMVDGVDITGPLTITDMPNGSNTTTNATAIMNKVGTGFTATVSGSTITVSSPLGTYYNGKAFTFIDGPSQPGLPAVAAAPATRATATLTVGSTGSTAPSTLGGIQVNGVTIMGALTTSDITNGTSTTTNATTIKNKINALTATTGYSATVSGSAVTILAPAGAANNGMSLVILPGTSQGATPATAPSNGSLVITAVAKSQTISLKCGSTFIGKTNTWTSSGSNTASTRRATLYNDINGTNANSYAISCTASPDTTAPTSLSCTITPPAGASQCSGGFTVDPDITRTTNTGPSGGSDASAGWTNLAPSLTHTAFSGGTDAVAATPATGWDNLAPYLSKTSFVGGTEPTYTYSSCTYKKHVHQYDDVYNKTGVNMLNASEAAFNLSNAITSTATQFKVLAQNQYLNPAVKLHVGDSSYLYNIDHGYTDVRNYTSWSNLDLGTLPTYDRTSIGSLVFNMPIDALTAKDWWGNGDIRSGLIPMKPDCTWRSAGTGDSNLYKPVMPPANGVDGPGVVGTSGNGWAGARHGGALVVQLIKATTPNSAIEENVAGRPEYGWRVKKQYFGVYVLAEYITYWHHPNNRCYNDPLWVKTAPQDNSSSSPGTPATGSTDPKIGDLSGGGGNVIDVTRTVSGNVTTYTITYANLSQATITRTLNADNSVTIITRAAGCADALCETRVDVAASRGTILVGGDERGLQARTGRVSWHELIPE